MPPVVSDLVEEPEPDAPYGVKGVGEPPTVVSTAAIVSALRDATGRELDARPGSPGRHRRALSASGGRRKNAQPGDALEVRRVAGCYAEPERESRRADPQVVRADDLTSPAEAGPRLGVDARDRLGDGNRLEPGEQMLDERVPARSRTATGAMNAVQELAHRDHADRALFGADERVELLGASSFPLDQQARVDQDCQ